MVPCAIVTYYGVEVSREVTDSAEWRVRVTGGGGFRYLQGWRWDLKLFELAEALRGPTELALHGCLSDIPFARDFGELRWARGLIVLARGVGAGPGPV